MTVRELDRTHATALHNQIHTKTVATYRMIDVLNRTFTLAEA